MVEFSIKPPSPSVNNKSNRLSSKRLGGCLFYQSRWAGRHL